MHVAGDYQTTWDISQSMLYSFDGSMYEKIVYVDSAQSMRMWNYIFANGNTTSTYETVPTSCANANNHREIMVMADTILPSIQFASCAKCGSTTGVEQVVQNAWSVYPNPCNDELKINNYELLGNNKVEVLDFTGRIVLEPIIHNSSFTTHNLPNGNYFLKIISTNNSSSIQKIIVQH